jgi:hypothetical protein
MSALGQRKPIASAAARIQQNLQPAPEAPRVSVKPVVSYAFYRRHTDSLLRRYLYASMQVGRTPQLLSDSVGRGWASSRPIRTFEDAVIFVLDVERCLQRLTPLERQLINRVVLQEYTHAEVAAMLGICLRTVGTRLATAIDRLTEILLEAEILILPY